MDHRERRLAIRFDVDTHLCMSKGVPNLIELANTHEVKFTFFINTGKAISYKEIFKSLLRRNSMPNAAEHLTAIEKLGLKEYLRLLFLNPKVTTGNENIVADLIDQGHEIGLHGGINHASWQMRACHWDEEKVLENVRWGVSQLSSLGVKEVSGFSSPCWEHPKYLAGILSKLGFKCIADEHGYDFNKKEILSSKIASIPTCMTAEPSGVAYFENLYARHLTMAEKSNIITKQLDAVEDFIVVYDHPYFLGIHDLPTLDLTLKIANKLGFKIVPMRELIHDC